ncbi:hypothetical protein CHS0354_005029 [Potamilus streckersoni]|uniref:Uncharacterized protein n=1 Tax=Potamilus streckersoni TaxID=2493646 RepID=A0AAE0W134_9BIVA|nr:hypothetical protein CHS0354_005029 [Potamilus streckersoni]
MPDFMLSIAKDLYLDIACLADEMCDLGHLTLSLVLIGKIVWGIDNIQIGCKELRAKRYISDGYCTSIKPIREVVCAGQCYPIKEQNLPWWTEFTKYWSKNKLKEWRCEEAVTRRKNVQLICGNGEVRTYKKIKVVKSCRCKFYAAEHNKSHRRDGKSGNKSRTRTRRKGRKGRSRKDRIGLSQNTSSDTTQQS